MSNVEQLEAENRELRQQVADEEARYGLLAEAANWALEGVKPIARLIGASGFTFDQIETSADGYWAEKLVSA
jgi:hypothetical protein